LEVILPVIVEATLAPPNSILFISDGSDYEIPETIGQGLVASTSSCIVVGTLMSHDGETTVLLCDDVVPAASSPEMRRVFRGKLSTERRIVRVTTAYDDEVVQLPVRGFETWIEIWANDESEPDRLCIVACD